MRYMERQFTIEGETVTVRQAGAGGPVVYLPVPEGDGRAEWEECRRLGCDCFTLAVINPLNWGDDMTPWECPPLFKNAEPCRGKAVEQLDLLLTEIKPRVERSLDRPATHSALAGYSLGGLFAVWAAFQTDAFDRIASVSGSLWYPRFVDYAAENALVSPLTCAYFSLGDREARTPNFYLKHVADATEAVVAAFEGKGVPTTFECNRGNHFKDEPLRTAKGIRWLLQYARSAQGCPER